jgi:hypothetical protein
VPLDALLEFPEQRMTKELMRISAALQRGDQADHCLVELFEVLTKFGREIDVDTPTATAQVPQFSEPVNGAQDNHRLSVLMAMLQDTQTRLRCRVLNLAERLEAHDAARQAHASYGGVAHGEHSPHTSPAFRTQS